MMAQKEKKEPENKSRMVIEGIDEPVRRPKYSDRVKIDPFTTKYLGKRRRTATKRA